MVSVIIPFIDESELLLEALDSVFLQTEKDIEVIAVCNAPLFPENLLPIADRSPKIQFIHEPRTGSAHARNAGLQTARGEWVQYLDVDDLLLSEKIKAQTEMDHADVVVSPHRYRFLSGKEQRSKWLDQDIWEGLLNSGLGSTSSMLWKRSALIEVNGWNPGYSSHQEYELLFRMMQARKSIVPVGQAATIVRQRREGSITHSSAPVRAIEGIRLREAIWHYLVTLKEDTPLRFEAFRQYIFKQLRNYYRRQPETALHLYRKYFSDSPFTPRNMHIPGYAFFYKLFGFTRVESFLTAVAKCR